MQWVSTARPVSDSKIIQFAGNPDLFESVSAKSVCGRGAAGGRPQAERAHEKAGKDCLDAEDDEGNCGKQPPDVAFSGGQNSIVRLLPNPEGVSEQDEAPQQEGDARQQALFEC